MIDQRSVRDIALYKCPAGTGYLRRHLLDFRQTVLFDGNIIIIVQVVDADYVHRLHGAQQFHHEIGTNEPRRTGHKDGFVSEFHIRCQHMPLYSFCTCS